MAYSYGNRTWVSELLFQHYSRYITATIINYSIATTFSNTVMNHRNIILLQSKRSSGIALFGKIIKQSVVSIYCLKSFVYLLIVTILITSWGKIWLWGHIKRYGGSSIWHGNSFKWGTDNKRLGKVKFSTLRITAFCWILPGSLICTS